MIGQLVMFIADKDIGIITRTDIYKETQVRSNYSKIIEVYWFGDKRKTLVYESDLKVLS